MACWKRIASPHLYIVELRGDALSGGRRFLRVVTACGWSSGRFWYVLHATSRQPWCNEFVRRQRSAGATCLPPWFVVGSRVWTEIWFWNPSGLLLPYVGIDARQGRESILTAHEWCAHIWNFFTFDQKTGVYRRTKNGGLERKVLRLPDFHSSEMSKAESKASRISRVSFSGQINENFKSILIYISRSA